MLLLTSTSDIVRVITDAAADIETHASYMDNASGTITPGRTNTASITTATTTTVVGAPGASTQRNVKFLSFTNNSTTVSTGIAVEHFDGTNAVELIAVTLLPGENLIFNAVGNWTHLDVQGGPYAYTAPARPNLGITGTLAESLPRELCPEVNTAVGATGVLYMQAIYLTAGQLVSNIIASSATTAAGTPTNYAFGLFDGATRSLLANTANQTTTAWAANTVKTIALSAAYRVSTSGLYYIGFYMTATTVLTMKGGTARTGAQLAGTAPILSGTSSTGLTTALPNPAAAITVTTSSIYVAVS